MDSGSGTPAATATRERRLTAVIGSLDTGTDATALSEAITDPRAIEPGPLFKEIYSGVMDMKIQMSGAPCCKKKYVLFCSPQIFIR